MIYLNYIKMKFIDACKKAVLKSAVSNQVNVSPSYFDHFKTNDLEYHSISEHITTDELSDKALLEMLSNSFINKLYPYISEDLTCLTLFRAVNLHDVDELSPQLGRHWTFDEGSARVYDDLGYDKDPSIERELFIIKSEIPLELIDINETFSYFMMNDWMENEVLILHDAKISNILIKKGRDGDYHPHQLSHDLPRCHNKPSRAATISL